MAILLAILVISGVQPGPAMLTRYLDLTISLVYIVALANIVVVPIMLFAAPFITRIAAIPPNVLAPIVIGIVTLAAYQATYSIEDLLLVLGFTVLGIFMKRYGWPRPPILIAVVLAEIVEKFLWLSINTYGFSMVLRPQFAGIIAVMVLVMVVSFRIQAGAKRVWAESGSATTA
jgi:TctA family transporter